MWEAQGCIRREGGGGAGMHQKGKGPQRRPQRRVDKRLEEAAKAVGGGYCRLQIPLKPALTARGTPKWRVSAGGAKGRSSVQFWTPGPAMQAGVQRAGGILNSPFHSEHCGYACGGRGGKICFDHSSQMNNCRVFRQTHNPPGNCTPNRQQRKARGNINNRNLMHASHPLVCAVPQCGRCRPVSSAVSQSDPPVDRDQLRGSVCSTREMGVALCGDAVACLSRRSKKTTSIPPS